MTERGMSGDDMIRIERIAPEGSWAGPALDAVSLDFDARFRRRLVLITAGGRKALLDLPRAQLLRDGDGLVTAQGVIAVRAAEEDLAEVRSADPGRLLRVAWHLGNRHLPTELLEGVIRIRRDHVIEHMLEHLGVEVAHVRAAFNPEGGAYGEGAVHGHDHARADDHHDHDHDHDEAHDHGSRAGRGHHHD